MRNVWILLLTLTISTLFIHVPHVGEVGFLFNKKVVLSYNQYVWWICQHLQIAALALIIWDVSQRPVAPYISRIYRGYLLVVVADIVIHALAYSDPLRNYRITWNIIKTVIFIGVIVYEKWYHKRRI